MEQQTKRCHTCKQKKPLAEFSKHYDFPDGRLNHCKLCINTKRRERYAVSEEIREKAIARKRDYYHRNAEQVKERERIYQQAPIDAEKVTSSNLVARL